MKEYFQFPNTPPAYAIIWLHGLGANGENMRGIAEAMDLRGLFIRHVFLDAPTRSVTVNQGMMMPAWYDVTGFQMTDKEDQAGIVASHTIIVDAIQRLRLSGFESNQIILAGFSQGAAMALYTALHHQERLAGVVALSGYLPLSQTITPSLPLTTPIFVGYGRYDSLVMPLLTQMSVQWLEMQRFTSIRVEDYPMDHCVCPEELAALSEWMKALIGEGA